MRGIGLSILRAFVPLTVVMCFGPSAWATAIFDTSRPDYITGFTKFTGVVQISSSAGLCSGSLVSPDLILTAGHCLGDEASTQVKFETPTGTFILGVSSSIRDPMFAPRAENSALFAYDVGFLTLGGRAPADATIYPIRGSLVGITTSSILDIVGYGFGGNPAQGVDPAGIRRHAQNTFDTFSNAATCPAPVSPAPDNPIKMCAFFQQFVIPTDTGLIMDGDSGGPALSFNITSGLYEILGVASFSNLHTTFDQPSSFYSGHANLTDPNTAAFVRSVLAADIVTPEPGSAITIGAGLLLLGLLQFRSQRDLPLSR